MNPKELTFLLSTLTTLVDNGVSMPKALTALAKDPSLAKHNVMLDDLCRKLESGVTFSAALEGVPHVCDQLTVNQIRVGERSGTLVETLRKLAYPGVLVTVGTGLITFLLLYVVPVFQETYDKAKFPLPYVTQALIFAGSMTKQYGGMLAVTILVTAITIRQLRKRAEFSKKMDALMLRLPVFGPLLRDMAVL